MCLCFMYMYIYIYIYIHITIISPSPLQVSKGISTLQSRASTQSNPEHLQSKGISPAI